MADQREANRQPTPIQEDAYTPIELAEAALSFSEAIKGMLRINEGDEINDKYEPIDGQPIKHVPMPDGNHVWRVVSYIGTLEIRTGPFFDDSVGKTYEPRVNVAMFNGGETPLSDGRKAFQAGVRILLAAIPQQPAPPIRG